MTEEIPVKDSIGGDDEKSEPVIGTTGSYATRNRPRIAQHRAFEEVSRDEALRRLESLHRLGHLITESNHDIKRMADAVARMACEMLGDMCVIGLLNSDNSTYRIAAYHDPDPEKVTLFEKTLEELGSIPLTQGWAARVITTGKSYLVPGISVKEAEKHAIPSLTEFTREAGITSLLIVPIYGRSGILGSLAMTRHREGRPYRKEDQSFLEEIAHRLGVAIEEFTLIGSLKNELAARSLATEELVKSEQRFLSIFSSAVFGIKIMDLVGSIVETNRAFQSMSGYSEGELIAMHFYDLVHPDDLPRTLEAFKSVKLGREPYARHEHRLLRKDGSAIWVRTTFAGVKKASSDQVLSLIFGIVENITERKQVEQELRELQQHLQASIELERLRLAQNLHDSPLQDLYAVIYKLEEVRLKSNDSESVELLRQSVAEIKKTLESLRSTASELRPPALSRFGLEKAIRSYAEDFKLKHPTVQLSLMLAHDAQLLSEPVRLVLFRVFQESLANVVRHTQATEVRVRFTFDAEEARIEIADNGKGFTVPPSWMSLVRKGHYELAGMAERVGAVGGVLTIESSPDSSTTVRAVLPPVYS